MFKKSLMNCLAPVILMMALLECSDTQDITRVTDDSSGMALLKIRMTAGSPFQQLANLAVITVSASDMLTITQQLTVTDTSVEGKVDGIPAGKDRAFTITVYDSLETLQYRGSTTADIVADSTVHITITIVRVSGTAVINGEIRESDSTATEGLVAYYPFNGNANDESGNGHDGEVNGATTIADRFGSEDSAYNFDGEDDVIEVPFSQDFNFSPNETFSFAVWVKPVVTEFYHAVVVKAPPDRDVWDWGLFIVNGHFTSGFHGNNSVVVSPAPAKEGVWTHVAVSYDNADWAMYVNGVLEDSADSEDGQVIRMSSGGIAFGRKGEVIRDFFLGQIDDMSLYRHALSPEEIDSLYHLGGWDND